MQVSICDGDLIIRQGDDVFRIHHCNGEYQVFWLVRWRKRELWEWLMPWRELCMELDKGIQESDLTYSGKSLVAAIRRARAKDAANRAEEGDENDNPVPAA